MKKSSLYLIKLRETLLFRITLCVVMIVGYYLIAEHEKVTLWSKNNLAILAIAISLIALIINVSKLGIENNLTFYHKMSLSPEGHTNVIIYNLSTHDLLIFSAYLGLKDKAGRYIHNSVDTPIKIDSLEHITIRLNKFNALDEHGKLVDSSLELITSLGTLQTKQLKKILTSSEIINAEIVDSSVENKDA